ncbi:hypothetical protein Syun_029165 [Stephania yunnanensis]|uniref:Phytocyanin domain-containing protein n=1 Tax=Stephania yunnanensis TaxID=152371 RepID=A0AAP0E517_9MAGN
MAENQSTLRLTMAAVYTVGDGQWTLQGPDYQKWADSKSFKVGDSVVFKYNTSFHNVLQVKKHALESCNKTAPLGTFTSGADTIALNATGHFYFFCGIGAHCEAGMKVIMGDESCAFAASTSGEGEAYPNFTYAFKSNVPLNSIVEALT